MQNQEKQLGVMSPGVTVDEDLRCLSLHEKMERDGRVVWNDFQLNWQEKQRGLGL